MNLGMTEKVRPLVEAVREFIRTEVAPREESFFDEVEKGGRWVLTDRQLEILDHLKSMSGARQVPSASLRFCRSYPRPPHPSS